MSEFTAKNSIELEAVMDWSEADRWVFEVKFSY